jgi:hypothetical protein
VTVEWVLLLSFREVSGSILSLETSHPNCCICNFPQPLGQNAGMSPEISTRPFPFHSFPINYSPIALPFGVPCFEALTYVDKLNSFHIRSKYVFQHLFSNILNYCYSRKILYHNSSTTKLCGRIKLMLLDFAQFLAICRNVRR